MTTTTDTHSPEVSARLRARFSTGGRRMVASSNGFDPELLMEWFIPTLIQHRAAYVEYMETARAEYRILSTGQPVPAELHERSLACDAEAKLYWNAHLRYSAERATLAAAWGEELTAEFESILLARRGADAEVLTPVDLLA